MLRGTLHVITAIATRGHVEWGICGDEQRATFGTAGPLSAKSAGAETTMSKVSKTTFAIEPLQSSNPMFPISFAKCSFG